MRISDLDIETKRVLTAARMVVRRATAPNLDALQARLIDFDKKHIKERSDNLFKALFESPIDCTRDEGHDGPCNGYICDSMRERINKEEN